MPGWRSKVHCELGPVLVNRSAVCKMRKAMPGELGRRGFRVRCSALLARLATENAEPGTPWDKYLYGLSRRWLSWAITRPRLFNRLRRLMGCGPRWRHRRGVSVFLDPLYTLFYGAADTGVVLVQDITTVTMDGWHHPHVTWLYGRAFDLLAGSSCHLVALCQNTADQLRANWGIAPHRLTVLPLGMVPVPQKAPVQGHAGQVPFFLFVGGLESRKNVAGLIRAYAASGLYAKRGIRLRIVGTLPLGDSPDLALARSTAGVDLPGFVADAELEVAYEQCLAFVYPGFGEGFGLPLLEAMHRGCACLVTNLGASPEIAGDAALYVDPYCQDNIVRGLRRVACLPDGERARFGMKARERSLVFTWKRFYDGLAEVIENQAA